MKKYQQGDVLLKEINSYGINFNEKNYNEKKDLILAEGEATGHNHRIVSGLAMLYVSGNDMFLKVISETALLKHQTHNPIEIPKGDYKIEIVKEYDDIEERRVLD